MTPRKSVLKDFNKIDPYLGKALKCIRALNEIDIKTLADNIECSMNYLYDIEAGKKQPSIDLLNKIANEFAIEVADIFIVSSKLKNFGDDKKYLLTRSLIKGLNMVDTNDHNQKLSSAANPASKSNTIG
jgi:DNA-binding XRE family transcriptional regulator